jgi:hypothetical protein
LCFGEALDGVQPPVPLCCGVRHGLSGFVEAFDADAVADLAAVPVCFGESHK